MQKYTKIPTSQTLQSSLPLILDNDLTVMSQNSGTAFPTSNLVVGMSCLRTDQDKIYTLKSINSEGVTTWVETSNLNAKVWTDLNHGPDSGLNADMVDGIQAAKVATANQLLALDANKKLPASITGDAATVAGYKPGLTSGALAINSGARNVNLNADMVDGYHAGNVAGAVAVNNGVLNADLNADMVDGHHAGAFVRFINGVAPDAAGNVAVQQGALPLTGGTMSGNLTAPHVHVNGGTLQISGHATYLSMTDTTTGRTRHVHHNDDLMGFLNTGGGWDLYANNVGQVWTANYGWLHDKFFNAIANCANTHRSTSGSGKYLSSSEVRIYQNGGQLQLGHHRVMASNCTANCNCDCGNA